MTRGRWRRRGRRKPGKDYEKARTPLKSNNIMELARELRLGITIGEKKIPMKATRCTNGEEKMLFLDQPVIAKRGGGGEGGGGGGGGVSPVWLSDCRRVLKKDDERFP